MNASVATGLGTQARPAAQAVAGPVPSRRVIDAATRMYHWLFALSFLGAYLTAEGERWRMLHVTLGYTMVGLLAFRVLYGLVGPRQQSLGSLWRKVSGAPAWLRSLRGAATNPGATPQAINWRQGQNLLMALAVVGMLALTVPLVLSGHALYNEWGQQIGDGEWLEEVHELLGNGFLAIVLAHLGLILGLSILRRRNQALPMLTGRSEGPGPDLIQHKRYWLAIAMLVAVIGFISWEWSQSPQGLIDMSPGLRQGLDDDADEDLD